MSDAEWTCACGESFRDRGGLDAHAFLVHDGASVEGVIDPTADD